MITLGCLPSDTLDWDLPKNEGPILWHFDLGLEDPFFPIKDEMHFESLALALKKFTREVWSEYKERTTGGVLYRGKADFSSWEHSDRLITADAFAYYFQMLAHSLPDEMPLYLFFDATDVGTIAERHQLLSRERFEHFQVVTKGLPFTNGLIWSGEYNFYQAERVPRALCLPEEKVCGPEVLARLTTKMDQIEKPFRVISESFLTEDWEGVDVIYVLEDLLREQGKRKLKGFEATGGTIVY